MSRDGFMLLSPGDVANRGRGHEARLRDRLELERRDQVRRARQQETFFTIVAQHDDDERFVAADL